MFRVRLLPIRWSALAPASDKRFLRLIDVQDGQVLCSTLDVDRVGTFARAYCVFTRPSSGLVANFLALSDRAAALSTRGA